MEVKKIPVRLSKSGNSYIFILPKFLVQSGYLELGKEYDIIDIKEKILCGKWDLIPRTIAFIKNLPFFSGFLKGLGDRWRPKNEHFTNKRTDRPTTQTRLNPRSGHPSHTILSS